MKHAIKKQFNHEIYVGNGYGDNNCYVDEFDLECKAVPEAGRRRNEGKVSGNCPAIFGDKVLYFIKARCN
ncbi:hypothetical protein PIPA1_00650 [Pelosinus sp. IPA-1]|nr:hypothetical protein PIPA1_00650 [Pelosinus sp. IPA-1]